MKKKMIKAYVRTFMVGDVIKALKKAGAPRISAIDVEEMEDEVDYEKFKISAELESIYTTMSKIELVCFGNDSIKKAVKIIRDEAETGRKGDGIIIISPVEEAYSIRTGEPLKGNTLKYRE